MHFGYFRCCGNVNGVPLEILKGCLEMLLGVFTVVWRMF